MEAKAPDQRGLTMWFCSSLPGKVLGTLLVVAASRTAVPAATVTVQANVLGPTPSSLAYNAGHFVPGSNTRDWWHYAGVNGARVFITPSLIEAPSQIPGGSAGITDQASFLLRRAALRADPLATTYVNWSYVTNQYGLTLQHGSNLINVNYAHAIDCKTVEMMNHPSIANNEAFWNEYSKLKKHDDQSILQLIKQHSAGSTLTTSAQTVATVSEEAFTLSNKAEKAHAILDAANKKRYDEFIKIINEKGPEALRENPSKWRYKKIREYGDDAHSIRLQGDYRVLFEVKDGHVRILDIGNHVTH